MSVKERIFFFIKKNNYKAAYEISGKYIREYQSDEQFVILYIMLRIAKDEKEAGVKDIFSISGKKDINELIAHYQNIKFCLRHFEYEVGEPARKDAMAYFKEFNVSLYALVYIAQYACVDVHKAVCGIANYYENDGETEKAEILRNTYC